MVLVGVCAVGAGAAGPTTASARPVFAVRGIATCFLYQGTKRLVCQRRGDPPYLSMKAKGRAKKWRRLKLKEPVARIAPPLLRLGEEWSQGRDFRCLYRGSGLTCLNAAGHGWWLGPQPAYRVF